MSTTKGTECERGLVRIDVGVVLFRPRSLKNRLLGVAVAFGVLQSNPTALQAVGRDLASIDVALIRGIEGRLLARVCTVLIEFRYDLIMSVLLCMVCSCVPVFLVTGVGHASEFNGVR